MVELGDSCGCSIALSLRVFIEIALKPTLVGITSVISASMVNQDLFGRYKIDHIFLLGNLFDCSKYDSHIHKIFTGAIKEALAISNEEKEIEHKCFFLLRSARDIVQAELLNNTCLFESIINNGTICQLAKETYSLCFTSSCYQ